MKPQKLLLFFLILFVCTLAVSSFSFSQTNEIEAGNFTKSAKVKAFDNQALAKLEKMSSQQVEALDQNLARALTLYYDGQYTQALPLFEEISAVVETMDVIFWHGSCAARTGQTDLAASRFKQMLDVDPDLHRVRLELARVYLESGRFQEARQELEMVKAAKPPESVARTIDDLLGSIDEKTRKIFTNLRLSMGIQRDSNVNSASSESIIMLPPDGGLFGAGGVITLGERGRSLKDWVFTDSIMGNLLYDMGAPRSWMWNTTASLFQAHVLEYSGNSLTQVRVTTGPWLAGFKGILRLPVGYTKNYFDHESLFHTLDFSPSYEHFFSNQYSLKGYFTIANDDYKATERRGEENDHYILGISPSFYFNNRRDILTVDLSYEDLDAKMDMHSYKAFHVSLSYYKPLLYDFEFYGRLKYTSRQYDGPTLLWVADREDDRTNLFLLLNKNFRNKYFASLHYNYIRNNSNTALYDYDKHVYGLTFGVKFSNFIN